MDLPFSAKVLDARKICMGGAFDPFSMTSLAAAMSQSSSLKVVAFSLGDMTAAQDDVTTMRLIRVLYTKSCVRT